MAVFIGIYGSLAIYFSKKLSYAVFLTRKNEEKIAGLTYESFNNIRTIKTIGSLTPIFNKIDSLYATARALITKRIMIGLTRSYLPDSIASMFRISMFIYIAYAVVDGKYEIGFLTLFFTYFNNVWDGAARLADVNQQYAINKNQVASLKQVLDEPVNIGSEDGKVQLPTNWQTITLKNISFAYGENEVLKNLSLTIKRGQKIGVIGLSGAGKSTLFKLLLKEREGFSGSISFDDTPLNTISSSSYFSKVAVVLQETEVFNFSVTDNITIGSDGNVNQAQLEQALEVSHVKDFLHKLPEGLDTLIGEKGFKLSGGEKQRLGIARAVYKQPELLLLDEATSHLDLESEQKIQDSLHQFFDSVTAIVIAHRLTTIREMDVIVVIEDGQIIEQGSFDELMAKHGRFAELWDKQKI
jgi:ATP-binding cassette subfamily B protein